MKLHVQNLLDPVGNSKRGFWKAAAYGVLGFFALLIVIGTAIAVPALLTARDVYAQAVAARDALYGAKESAERLEFAAASGRLEEAAQRFEAARRAEQKLSPFKALPFLKKELQGVSDLLEGGREASLALKEALDIGVDAISILKSGEAALDGASALSGDARAVSSLTREERRVLLQHVSQAPDRLAVARTSLDRALAAWDRVEKTAFTEGVLASIEPYKERLRFLRGLMTRDLSPLAMLPSIFGYPEPKTYLFLMLNNTELRPGGGFVGTYGILEFADAEMTKFFTDDIYALDGPSEAYLKEAAPEPLKKYLRVPSWYMRDSNWSPDFAVSAMNVEKFYRLEGGKEAIDGVIGITPTVISKLLAITGPITIDGSTFTSENVVDELEYRVEVAFWTDGTPQAQRKDVVGKLGQELIKRLLGMKLSQLSRLAEIAQESVAEKHLMAYFHDSAIQNVADANGWTGRFRSAPGDSLAVIDANLASLKTDAVVDRTLSYTLRPDAGAWIAREHHL